MNNAEYRFNLDIRKVQSQVTFQVNKGETAWSFLISLYNGGELYEIEENATVVLSAKKSSGRYLFNSCSIVDRSTIRYDFTSATTDTPGVVQCEVLITSSSATIIAPRFTIVVDTLINDDEVHSADENNFYIKAMAQEGARMDEEAKRIANEEARQNRESSMAEELSDAKRRIANLEAAATGSLYETIEESEIAHTKQLGEVLPYGILSQIDDGAKRVEIGMPYQLSGAESWRDYGECIVKDDSVIMCKGSTYGIVMPCVLPKGAKVTVTADGRNSDADRIYKYMFRKYTSNVGNDTSASSEATIGETCTLTDASTHLYISKYSATSKLTTDLEISNIRVTLTNPDEATLYSTNTINIPSEFSPIDIPLKPGCLMRFFGDGNSAHDAAYTLAYKQKIGG